MNDEPKGRDVGRAYGMAWIWAAFAIAILAFLIWLLVTVISDDGDTSAPDTTITTTTEVESRTPTNAAHADEAIQWVKEGGVDHRYRTGIVLVL